MTTQQEGTTFRSSDPGGDRLQEAAGKVADRVTDTAQQQVGTRVDSGLARAGDMLEQVAGAVRRTGDEMRGDQPQIATFADTAASQVDRAAQYLRETDMQDLVGRAEDFARRQPAIFIGGALMLGLVASRFLKASPSGVSGSRHGYGYGSAYGTGYGGSMASEGDRWSAASNGGWDRGSSGLQPVGPGGSAATSGVGTTVDDRAPWSSDEGVLEHGRA